MHDVAKLRVWRSAMRVSQDVHRFACTFPDHARFELAQQIRRSATSVASNIAEGRGRRTDKDFAKFLRIAYASAGELDTQIRIARGRGYDTDDVCAHLLTATDEIRRMLAGLIRRIESDQRST